MNGEMVENIKDSILKIRRQGMECICIQMEAGLKGNGGMDNRMEWGIW